MGRGLIPLKFDVKFSIFSQLIYYYYNLLIIYIKKIIVLSKIIDLCVIPI